MYLLCLNKCTVTCISDNDTASGKTTFCQVTANVPSCSQSYMPMFRCAIFCMIIRYAVNTSDIAAVMTRDKRLRNSLHAMHHMYKGDGTGIKHHQCCYLFPLILIAEVKMDKADSSGSSGHKRGDGIK